MNPLNFFFSSRILIGAISSLAGCLCLLSCGTRQSTTEISTARAESQSYRFASGDRALGIPFEEDDGHIFFQVRINSSDPLWFGLDTGAIRSIIDRRWAQSLGLKSEGSQRIGGAGGYEEGSIIKNITIKLPGVELYNQTFWGLSLDTLSPANGREIAGIIGYDLFRHLVVDIDYAATRMNLYEPQNYQYQGAGRSVRLIVQEDGEIYVQASVEAPGRKPVEGEFVIDTGGNGTLMLARPFVEQHRLLESVGQTLQGRGGGVGGEIQFSIGRLKNLHLGNFVFSRPITFFMRLGEIADRGKAGNIGGRLLRRFRIIFDYSRKRMILEPNTYFHESEEFDMTGAALMTEPPDFKVIKVIRVRENSPAAEAGLRPQDLIVAIDSEANTSLSLSKVKKMFRQEGREYLLHVKRGEQTLQIKIKLRRLL